MLLEHFFEFSHFFCAVRRKHTNAAFLMIVVLDKDVGFEVDSIERFAENVNEARTLLDAIKHELCQ